MFRTRSAVFRELLIVEAADVAAECSLCTGHLYHHMPGPGKEHRSREGWEGRCDGHAMATASMN